MKRVLKWVGIVLGVLALLVAGVWYYAFGHNSPIVDGKELGPGVHTIKEGYVSVFVIDVGNGKVALVDAGHVASGKPILDALAARGMNASSVAAIFLTHGHGDHTAACKAFPDAAIYALAEEAPVIGDDAKITHPLKDGEAVDVGDTRVEAFAVPGHTKGSAAYLSHGVLFFGDSAGASKEGKVMKAVSLFSSSSAQNVASLEALEARLAPRQGEIHELAFAHTGPLSGFAPLADFAKGP